MEKSVPTPVSATLCGLLGASSVMVILAEPLPVAAGLKVTLIEHFAPAARLAAHVLVWEKSPLFAPVIEIVVMVSVELPELVSPITCAAPLVPTP
jgi:hypothetical protein